MKPLRKSKYVIELGEYAIFHLGNHRRDNGRVDQIDVLNLIGTRTSSDQSEPRRSCMTTIYVNAMAKITAFDSIG